MKILIIDDDRLTTSAISHNVEILGHKPSVAATAEDAMKMIGNDNYDLIISDIMMPGISGLSLVTVLRTVQLNFTPIIMMSTLHNKHLLDAAIQAGANDFLDKPVSLSQLEAKVKQFEKKKA
jgi:DNA-binding response OmpR family regulator